MGGFGGFATLFWLTDILCRVESRSFGGRNETLSTILFATNGLFNGLWFGFCSRLFGFFEPLVQTALCSDLGSGETSTSFETS